MWLFPLLLLTISLMYHFDWHFTPVTTSGISQLEILLLCIISTLKTNPLMGIVRFKTQEIFFKYNTQVRVKALKRKAINVCLYVFPL